MKKKGAAKAKDVFERTLMVKQAEDDDVFEDIVRINTNHRKGIKAGEACVIRYGKKRIAVVMRNTRGGECNVIRMDDTLRTRLGVEEEQTYDFEIRRASFLDNLSWGWHSTNVYVKSSARLAFVGFVLGVIGLLSFVIDVIGLIRG